VLSWAPQQGADPNEHAELLREAMRYAGLPSSLYDDLSGNPAVFSALSYVFAAANEANPGYCLGTQGVEPVSIIPVPFGQADTMLTIGHLASYAGVTIRAVRHYHQIGLLEPVDVDRATGYRRYGIDQISTAQIIRRFRALEMPLDEIRTVMSTTDIRRRNELINAHLMRLESQLAQTKRAVESLRELLEPGPVAEGRIGHRRVEATEAVAISEVVDVWSTCTENCTTRNQERALRAIPLRSATNSDSSRMLGRRQARFNVTWTGWRWQCTGRVRCGTPARADLRRCVRRAVRNGNASCFAFTMRATYS